MSGGKSTACARCDKDGHWARNCTVARPPCFKCGEATHWAKECPQSGSTDQDKASLQAKLEAMQARIDQSDARFESERQKRYNKEKKRWNKDSYGCDEGNDFMSYDEYRARDIGGKALEDYFESVREAQKNRRKVFLQSEIDGLKETIKKKQDEIDKL